MREFIKEQDFQKQITDTVMPYLAARAKKTPLAARDGAPLYAIRYNADHPCGTVVIVHGFSENADKYRELIYYLLREELSVLVYDQRGHGRSSAMPTQISYTLTALLITLTTSRQCSQVLRGHCRNRFTFLHTPWEVLLRCCFWKSTGTCFKKPYFQHP